MRRFLDSIRQKKNNKGMSIVTVIVSIGFVAILVSIILLASIVNFKMKSVNVYAKDSFYSAEQVLDEINVGLQQMVSDGLSSSYKYVLENYNSEELTSEEKNQLVKSKYYEYLWDKLGVTGDKDSYYYVMPIDLTDAAAPQGLYGLLKDTTKWNTSSGDKETYYGAFLRAGDYEADGAYTGKITNYDKNGIVLEDLYVYYKDYNGFVSAIKTDIRLGYPDFSFSDNNIAEIANYAFITDTMLEDKLPGTKASAQSLKIKGNSYAYAVDTTGVKFEHIDQVDDIDLHIVAADYSVANGAITTNKNSVLWSGDIDIKSSDLVLAGQTYVKDDLNITGKNSTVKLSGYYTGFGNSLTDSDSSSAILVNGTDTAIDLTAVKKLSLAGRAYIGIGSSDKYKSKIGDIIDGQDTPDNVYTGESIAVKSNQLMYLVPAECIGCSLVTGDDGSTKEGNSLYGKNPLTLTEYNELMNQVNSGAAVEVSVSKNISKMSNFPLSGYIKLKSNGQADVEKLFIRTSTGSSLVYYYMKFASDEAANEYFKIYYSANKESVERYMNKYLKSLTLPTTGVVSFKVDMAALAVSGKRDNMTIDPDNAYTLENGYTRTNIVETEDPDTGEIEKSEAYESIAATYEDDCESYNDQFTAYISKLTGSLDTLPGGTLIRTSLSDTDTRYAVFDNIIDEEMFNDVVHKGSDEEFSYNDGTGEVKAKLINRADTDTIVPVDSSYDLIIANCGIEVSGTEHKGTIIAKGKIKVNGAYSFETDSQSVQKCLGIETDDGVYKVSDVFKDVDASTMRAVEDGLSGSMTTASLVEYENWTKSVDIK